MAFRLRCVFLFGVLVGGAWADNCGVNSVNSIIEYYSPCPGEAALFSEDIFEEGRAVSLLEFKQLLLSIGIPSKGYRLSINELNEPYLPAVAHLKNNHFVAVLEASERTLLVSEKPSQWKIVSREAFARDWSGVMLHVEIASRGKTGEVAEVSITPSSGQEPREFRTTGGFLRSREPVRVTWRLDNQTGEELAVARIDSSCVCLDYEPKEFTLSEGGATTFTASLNLAGQTGLVTTGLTIYWEQAEICPLRLSYACAYVPRFQFSVPSLTISRVAGTTATKEIAFRSSISPARQVRFVLADSVQLERIRVFERDDGLSTGSITLSVRLPEEAEARTGVVKAVDITTSETLDELALAITALPRFRFEPSYLYLGTLRDGSTPVRKAARLISAQGESFVIRELRANDLDCVTTATRVRADEWLVRISTKPAARRLSGEVEALIDLQNTPIRLKVIGETK